MRRRDFLKISKMCCLGQNTANPTSMCAIGGVVHGRTVPRDGEDQNYQGHKRDASVC